MTTKLGKRIAALKIGEIVHPVLKKLVREIHGVVCCGGRGFNDRGGIHSDYVNNRGGGHTDLTKEAIRPHQFSDSDYTDITYRDGWSESHGDEYSPSDAHTDTGWHRSYSDMCR